MPQGPSAPVRTASNDNTMTITTASLARDDIATDAGPTMGDVIAARFGRRDLIKGLLAATALSAITGPLTFVSPRSAMAAGSAFSFTEIAHGVDEKHHVAPGYDADITCGGDQPGVPGKRTESAEPAK